MDEYATDQQQIDQLTSLSRDVEVSNEVLQTNINIIISIKTQLQHMFECRDPSNVPSLFSQTQDLKALLAEQKQTKEGQMK